MRRIALLLVAFSVVALAAQAQPAFEPTWESLNARETPDWFRDAKFGIFIHWGVYSVPAYCHTSTYAEWYYWWLKTNSHDGFVTTFHEKNYGADFQYREFAPMFRAELYEPAEWAKLFKRSGAKYVVLVSKHHDGFALWPSKEATAARGYAWNAMEAGPRRDLLGELTDAVRAEGLKMGYYYSFMEWENPIYDADPARYVEEVMIPEVKDLVTTYKPDVFWPDGEWDHPDTLWRSPEVLAWIYNNCANPDEIVVNDRWGKDLRGRVGDFYTTEYGHVPWAGTGTADASKPFEECRGTGHSFAYNRIEDYDHYQSRQDLVRLLIDLVSQGGNLLLNLGPSADGRIPVIMQDRIIAIGDWLAVNGESIYGTRAGCLTNLPWGRTTTKGNTVYLHVFDWPKDNVLRVDGLMTPVTRAYPLHEEGRPDLTVRGSGTGALEIDLLGRHPFEHASVIALELAGEPVVDLRVRPSADGSLTLPAERAALKGGVRLEAGPDAGGAESTNIGFWGSTDDIASWEAALTPGVTYQIELDYACLPGEEGSTFVVRIGDKEIRGTVTAPTAGWRDFTTVAIGEIDAGEVESATVSVQALSIPEGRHLMNLRAIRLTPVIR